MTTPERSTRRSVNPPEGEQKPAENGDHTHNLAEVESILDEIENLVSRKGREKEETAISTPVFEEIDQDESKNRGMTDDPETDLGRLEKELQSAIATELEKAPEKNRASRESEGEDEDEIKKLTEVFEEAESNRSGNEEPDEPERSSITEPITDGDDETTPEDVTDEEKAQESRLLMMLARPMQGLSPTTRLIVNITAITLALWVPIIWLVVLSGGLSTPDPDALNGLNSDVPGETVSEPIHQEEMASEDA